MARRSDRPCQQRFAEFVGLSPERSQYEPSYLNVNAKGWAQGDREMICVFLDPSRRITGSARGIRR